jgi:hypothetical protein
VKVILKQLVEILHQHQDFMETLVSVDFYLGVGGKRLQQTFYPTTTLGTQNLSVRYPGASSASIDVDLSRRGWKRFFRENSTTEVTAFSFAIALPTEIFLSPNQSFSATCGAYNIIAMTES